MVTVFVKTLSGGLTVEVDPALGLNGVRQALHSFSPEEFPLDRLVVINMDRTNPPLTDESVLLVVINDEPMCNIISVEDEVLPGTNRSYEVPCRHWTFMLESGEECHVYRYKNPKQKYPHYTISKRAYKIGSIDGPQNIENLLGGITGTEILTPRDAFVINLSLRHQETMQFEQHPVLWDTTKTALIFCECGLVVARDKMKAHLKTKVKHVVGDEKGREFMEKARDYVSNWGV